MDKKVIYGAGEDMRKITVICMSGSIDTKCGNAECLKFYSALAEKYSIRLIVPRIVDFGDDNAKFLHPNITVKSIATADDGIKKIDQNNFFSQFELINDDKLCQEALYNEAKDSEFIICESIYHVMLARNTFPDKKIIYRSIDLEYDKFIWFNKYTDYNQIKKDQSEYAFAFEKAACDAADYIFALTSADAERMQELYALPKEKLSGVIPICFDKAEILRDYAPRRKEKNAVTKGVFLSATRISDAEKMVEHMKNLSEVEFHIIGAGGYELRDCSSNVIIHGRVSEEEKNRIIKECDFALNITPMTFGMNVKMIDYVSLGTPVISNELGVRGFNAVAGKHYILADDDNFEEAIRDFCVLDEDERYAIALNAFDLICNEYDYKKYINSFDEFCSDSPEEKEDSYYIFGAGLCGEWASQVLNGEGIECLGFADNNPSKYGTAYCGKTVYSPAEVFEDINNSDNKKLIIAVGISYMSDIVKQAVQHIDAEKIVLFEKYALSIEDMRRKVDIEKIRRMKV